VEEGIAFKKTQNKKRLTAPIVFWGIGQALEILPWQNFSA